MADIEKAFYQITKKALSDLKEITRLSDISMNKNSFDVADSFSYAEAAVDAAVGGIVGSSVAGGLWWALVGSTHAAVIAGPGGAILLGVGAATGPLGWTAIGAVSLLGTVGAAWGTNKMRKNKKLNAAIVHLRNNMEKISLKSIKNFRYNITEFEKKIKSSSIAMFEKVETQSKHELEAMLADLKKTKQLSEKETAGEIEIRQNYLKNIRKILDQLNSIYL